MYEKIKEFLESDRTDFLDFIASLKPATTEDIFLNSQKRKGFKDDVIQKRFLENGIYENVAEYDFIAFSFSILKMFAKDKDLVNLIKTIEKFNQNDFRVKRLRINLFLNLLYIKSGFFDINLYRRCSKQMKLSIERLIHFIRVKGYEPISVGYDAVMAVIPKPEAEEILEFLNKEFDPIKLRLNYYPRVIKFMNIIRLYDENGKKTDRLITFTKPEHEKLKMEILEHLDKGEPDWAIQLINANQHLSKRCLNNYRQIIEDRFL